MSFSKTNSVVGMNQVQPAPCGSFIVDVFAPVGGGDVIKTGADCLADAIAAGATLNDGNPPTKINGIKVQLKPVGGDFTDGGGVTSQSTTSDALLTVNGGLVDFDAGGAAGHAGHMFIDGSHEDIAATITNLTVKEGSIVRKELVLA